MKINSSKPESFQVSNNIQPNPTSSTQSTKINTQQSTWDSFVSETAQSGGAIDPNALVQHVLRESYVQTTEDLRFYADKVKYFNTCKKLVREYIQDLRDYDQKFKDELSTQLEDMKPGKMNSNVMETLCLVFRDSIREQNEDKKDVLNKLASMNRISQEVSDQTKKIVNASGRLAAKEKKDDDD